MSQGSYGWRRDRPDIRDHKFAHTYPKALPTTIDLRKHALTIYDQGELGSCTANAAAALYEMIQGINKKTAFQSSRLFIYYNTRALEGTINEDSGASIRDTMTAISARGKGCPKEVLWPYNINKFSVKPPTPVYTEGKKHTITKYSFIDNSNVTNIKHALALGYPVIAGFTVYQSFESQAVAKTGIVPMPGAKDPALGGHAVLIVGYADTLTLNGKTYKNYFIVRNSWGAGWGDKGYFYMPYDYFTNTQLADDFWTASLAT